jgi:hypothetical protein
MSVDLELKRRATPVAKHECGHYFVGRALGFNTRFCAVTINPGRGHLGETEIILPAALRNIPDTLSYLERRVQVLYAGGLAEALNKKGVDKREAIKHIHEASDQDHAKVKELSNIIRNLRHPDTLADGWQSELDAIDLELFDKSASVVLSERKHIETIALRLVREVKAYNVRVELSAYIIDAALET